MIYTDKRNKLQRVWVRLESFYITNRIPALKEGLPPMSDYYHRGTMGRVDKMIYAKNINKTIRHMINSHPFKQF